MTHLETVWSGIPGGLPTALSLSSGQNMKAAEKINVCFTLYSIRIVDCAFNYDFVLVVFESTINTKPLPVLQIKRYSFKLYC